MIDPRLTESLVFEKPYLGRALRALQGHPQRHAYMQALVELLAKRNFHGSFKLLEVGSWAGGSAITWAKAIKRFAGNGQIVCVDHWQPYFDTATDADDVYLAMNEAAGEGLIYGLFLHNIRAAGVGSMISPIVGRSEEVLPRLKKSDFTIVYLDASHDFASVQSDLRLAMDLVEEGGVLCGDDLELQASQLDPSELALDVDSRRDYVTSRTLGTAYHPGVTRAVAEALGEVSLWEGFWAMTKRGNDWEKIDLTGCTVAVPEHIRQTSDNGAHSEHNLEPQVAMISQIAERINKLVPAYQCAPDDVPELVATYHGYNIVRLGKFFYGVSHNAGEIDWSVPTSELAKHYGEINFITTDPGAIVEGAGLRELQGYLEKVTSALTKSVLRQESAVGLAQGHSSDLQRTLDETKAAVGELRRNLQDARSEIAQVRSEILQAQAETQRVKGNMMIRLGDYIARLRRRIVGRGQH